MEVGDLIASDEPADPRDGLREAMAAASRVRRKLPSRGTITALAATRSRLAWLADTGQDQMTVESVSLAETGGGGPP